MKKTKTKKQKVVKVKRAVNTSYKTYFYISLAIIVLLTGFLTYFLFAQYNPFTLIPASIDINSLAK
ncbi:MAG: hypothetical protein HYW86_04995 [Candidatus Roizmanbacteria bacterium]|nr:MAG: hypothetical protein HYW86_04995 [Candidatus Roizmanbacteria bacterium]